LLNKYRAAGRSVDEGGGSVGVGSSAPSVGVTGGISGVGVGVAVEVKEQAAAKRIITAVKAAILHVVGLI